MTGTPLDRADVAAVLAGEVSYDDLDTSAQAVVRAAWSRGMDERIAELDLAAELSARGASWSECDQAGRVVVVHADGTREYPD